MHNPHSYSSKPQKLSACWVRVTPPSSSTRKFLDNIFYLKMDNLRRLEQIKSIPWNRHHLSDRSKPLEHLEDHDFQARFRFSKVTVRSIFDMISDDLSTLSSKQLLASLRFFATESFQAMLVTCFIFHSRRLVVLLTKLLKPSRLIINNSSISLRLMRHHLPNINRWTSRGYWNNWLYPY